MRPADEVRESVDGFNASYYRNSAAQSSATTVPLVLRTSHSSILAGVRDDDSLIRTSERNSELYNGLLEEVRQPPGMSSDGRGFIGDDDVVLPSSLQIANKTKAKSKTKDGKASKKSADGASKSRSKAKEDVTELPKKPTKKGSRSAPRDSLQEPKPTKSRSGKKPSKKSPAMAGLQIDMYDDRQSMQDMGTADRGLTLPNTTYQPQGPGSRLTIDTATYKAYRPSEPVKDSAGKSSKKSGSKKMSKKALATGATAGVATGAAVAALSSPVGRSSDPYSEEMGHRADAPFDSPAGPLPAASPPPSDMYDRSPGLSPRGSMRSPTAVSPGGNDYRSPTWDTEAGYPQSPPRSTRESFESARRSVVDNRADDNAMSPLDATSYQDQAFDHSTPGSPHDSPIDMQPSSARSPGQASQSFGDYDGDTGDVSRSLGGSPAGSLAGSPLPAPQSPSSSFGGSEAMLPDEEYLGEDVRSMPGSQDDLGLSPRDSFEGDTRSISLSDPGDEFADEKGMEPEVEEKKPLWQQPKILIMAGVALLVIIILIIVGIVFAVRSKNNSNSNSNSNSGSSPASTGNINQGSDVIGGFRSQDPALVSDAFAMTGTGMTALTFGSTGRKRQTSGGSAPSSSVFINFYQHSDGEIRMSRFMNSQFQPSLPVAANAHSGTPITAYIKSSNLQMSVFYFDQNKVLQEIRSQADGNWVPGSIGALGLTSNAPSDLTVDYIANCRGTGVAWLVFHTGVNDQSKLLYWNEATDTWIDAGGFPAVKQGAGFAGQNDPNAWRFYFVSSVNSQLTEMVCPNCCVASTPPIWVPGINGPPVTSATGGIAVVNAGEPRLIYYQDNDGTVRELNNTGRYPNENYMMNVTAGRRGNSGTPAPRNAATGPVGSAVTRVSPNTKMGIAAGFQSRVPQLWLFAQLNETDVSLLMRNVDGVGAWTQPVPIPVGK